MKTRAFYTSITAFTLAFTLAIGITTSIPRSFIQSWVLKNLFSYSTSKALEREALS